jgi:hypothetical protein
MRLHSTYRWRDFRVLGHDSKLVLPLVDVLTADDADQDAVGESRFEKSKPQNLSVSAEVSKRVSLADPPTQIHIHDRHNRAWAIAEGAALAEGQRTIACATLSSANGQT